MIASGWRSTLLCRVSVPYRIRRSDRARRIRVSVDNDGQVEVILPKRSPERHAEEAVRQLGPWIERRKRAVARAVSDMKRAPGTVPYLGESLRLVPDAGRTRVHRSGDALLVPAHDMEQALERWYRRQAKLEIGPRLDAAVARYGTSYTGLTIRGQRTRWASRSSSGGMSFNWRLLLAPPETLLTSLAEAGLFGVAGPRSQGGHDVSPAVFAELVEALASGCLATAFVWVQHHGAVRALTETRNQPLADAWLTDLCAGRRRA